MPSGLALRPVKPLPECPDPGALLAVVLYVAKGGYLVLSISYRQWPALPGPDASLETAKMGTGSGGPEGRTCLYPFSDSLTALPDRPGTSREDDSGRRPATASAIPRPRRRAFPPSPARRLAVASCSDRRLFASSGSSISRRSLQKCPARAGAYNHHQRARDAAWCAIPAGRPATTFRRCSR